MYRTNNTSIFKHILSIALFILVFVTIAPVSMFAKSFSGPAGGAASGGPGLVLDLPSFGGGRLVYKLGHQQPGERLLLVHPGGSEEFIELPNGTPYIFMTIRNAGSNPSAPPPMFHQQRLYTDGEGRIVRHPNPAYNGCRLVVNPAYLIANVSIEVPGGAQHALNLLASWGEAPGAITSKGIVDNRKGAGNYYYLAYPEFVSRTVNVSVLWGDKDHPNRPSISPDPFASYNTSVSFSDSTKSEEHQKQKVDNFKSTTCTIAYEENPVTGQIRNNRIEGCSDSNHSVTMTYNTKTPDIQEKYLSPLDINTGEVVPTDQVNKYYKGFSNNLVGGLSGTSIPTPLSAGNLDTNNKNSAKVIFGDKLGLGELFNQYYKYYESKPDSSQLNWHNAPDGQPVTNQFSMGLSFDGGVQQIGDTPIVSVNINNTGEQTGDFEFNEKNLSNKQNTFTFRAIKKGISDIVSGAGKDKVPFYEGIYTVGQYYKYGGEYFYTVNLSSSRGNNSVSGRVGPGVELDLTPTLNAIRNGGYSSSIAGRYAQTYKFVGYNSKTVRQPLLRGKIDVSTFGNGQN